MNRAKITKQCMLGVAILASNPQVLWALQDSTTSNNLFTNIDNLVSPAAYSCTANKQCKPKIINRTKQCQATQGGATNPCQETKQYAIQAYSLNSANCDSSWQVLTTPAAALTPYTVKAYYLDNSSCATTVNQTLPSSYDSNNYVNILMNTNPSCTVATSNPAYVNLANIPVQFVYSNGADDPSFSTVNSTLATYYQSGLPQPPSGYPYYNDTYCAPPSSDGLIGSCNSSDTICNNNLANQSTYVCCYITSQSWDFGPGYGSYTYYFSSPRSQAECNAINQPTLPGGTTSYYTSPLNWYFNYYNTINGNRTITNNFNLYYCGNHSTITGHNPAGDVCMMNGTKISCDNRPTRTASSYFYSLPLSSYNPNPPATTTVNGTTYYYCGDNSSSANKQAGVDTCYINSVKQANMQPCINIWNSYQKADKTTVTANSQYKLMTLTDYNTLPQPYSYTDGTNTTYYYCGNNSTATGSGKATNDQCWINNIQQPDMSACNTAYANRLDTGSPGIPNPYSFTVDLIKSFTPS
jgi:hypothetical protein